MSVVRVLRHGHEVDQIAELNICNNISGFVVGLVANQRNINIWYMSHQLSKGKSLYLFPIVIVLLINVLIYCSFRSKTVTNNEKLIAVFPRIVSALE